MRFTEKSFLHAFMKANFFSRPGKHGCILFQDRILQSEACILRSVALPFFPGAALLASLRFLLPGLLILPAPILKGIVADPGTGCDVLDRLVAGKGLLYGPTPEFLRVFTFPHANLVVS